MVNLTDVQPSPLMDPKDEAYKIVASKAGLTVEQSIIRHNSTLFPGTACAVDGSRRVCHYGSSAPRRMCRGSIGGGS